MDEAVIRRDCAEADAVAECALAEEVEPAAGQVDRLREALRGHLRLLVDAVDEEFAGAPASPLRAIVTKALRLAEDVLAQPVLGSVLDLMALPVSARLLLLIYTEPEVFGASQEMPPLSERPVDAV